MGDRDAEIDCEVNCVIDQILREDRLESMGLDPCPDSREASCEEITEEPHTNCAIETSARFSIRILEALRAVQRQKATHTWASCTMEEVVQYIRSHYHHDGDLCSQVETALDQVTAQGFVLKMGANRYHLVGPFACSVRKPPAIGSSNRKRPNSRGPGPSRGRRKRPGIPNANPCLTAPDYRAPSPLDRLAAAPDIEAPESVEFQNRSNRERSLAREVGQPFNENQEISILEEMNAPALNEPIPRPAGGYGHRQLARDLSFDENLQEIHPPVPIEPTRRIAGGGGRRRVDRDHGVGGTVDEVYPLAPNEPLQRLGGCNVRGELIQVQSSDENMEEIGNPVPIGLMRRPDGCGGRQPVVREHSSDENMYCVEPAMNSTRGRPRCQNPGSRRRRDCSSSRSSSDTVISGCPTHRSGRNNVDCSSDADISDDMDVDEPEDGKPWVRNCQNEAGRMFTPRGRDARLVYTTRKK